MNLEKVTAWVVAQVQKAKTAWLGVVILAGMLGYQVQATKLPESTTLGDKINIINKQLEDLQNLKASLDKMPIVMPKVQEKVKDLPVIELK
jgi:hypothetical protein